MPWIGSAAPWPLVAPVSGNSTASFILRLGPLAALSATPGLLILTSGGCCQYRKPIEWCPDGEAHCEAKEREANAGCVDLILSNFFFLDKDKTVVKKVFVTSGRPKEARTLMRGLSTRLGPFSILLILAIWPGSAYPAESNLLANGGFEAAARMDKAKLERLVKAGMRFEDADPLLPARWGWNPSGNPEVRLAGDARTGQRALRVTVKGSGLYLNMSVVEVVPGAAYSFGVWSKGSGTGAVLLYGNAFEGRKELGRRELAAGPAWGEARGEVTIPGNVRTVSLEIIVWGDSSVTLDDAFVSATLAKDYNLNVALNEKPKADADTLAFVDFDGQGQYRLESGAKITEEGRFGKGLRLERALASTAAIPLSLERMPEEGTLEFWFAPDDIPEHIYVFFELLAGNLDVMKLQADTSDTLRLCWRKSGGIYDRQNSIACHAALSRNWFRRGQWHHVAMQWDKEAVRFYVNGVLFAYSTDKPLPFFATPSALKLGAPYSGYCWSGVVDEVRLSKVQRYGPFVPVEAKWTPFLVAAADESAPEAPVAKERPAPNFATEREKLIGAIPPPPAGAVSFGAETMQPVVRDSECFRIEKDSPVPGMTTARIGNTALDIWDPDNDGGYWKLGAFLPMSDFVGVWYESGTAGAENAQQFRGSMTVHLNGRVVQMSTTSDPVQVAKGVYFAEAQSEGPMLLKPGDEIAVFPSRNRSYRVARLTLHPTEPVRGHGWIPTLFNANWFTRGTALRLNLDTSFLAPPGKGVRNAYFRLVQEVDLPGDLRKAADGRALAQCRIANPLPVPLTVEYRAEIKAYFRELVGEDRATLALQPHERITREIPFTLIPDSRRYTIEAHARAINPPSVQSLRWPAADTISFFPGVRQSLPWPDPFTAKDERSLQFAGALPGERRTFSLNGTWQSAFTTSLSPAVPPPAGLEWQPRQVPMPYWACRVDNITPRPHGIYLRRTFTAQEKEQQTYRLVVDSVIDEATVYVNGQKVGNLRGTGSPLLCDITNAIKVGENDVLIVVRDALSIMDPDYVNLASPVMSTDYLDAPGGASSVGFGLYEVSVESSPLVAANELLVVPSVRKKELTARFVVTNHQPAAVKARVVARVLDAGKPVLELGTRELSLEREQSAPVSFTKSWANPELWGPGSPKLYSVAIEIVDTTAGKRLDLLRERFGFRESWVNKDRVYFNGAPVRMKGSTCQGGGGVSSDDIQWSRGTQIPDFMDEFGYLVSQWIGGLANQSSRHNVERDVFWETAQRNVLAAAKRQANHPCIIAWDLSNEWLSFLDYGGGDPMKGAKRFKALDDALKEFDPSRWTFFNGDEDLHGLHDTYSTHYMLESTNPHPVAGYQFRGHSNYFPDGAFFRPLDKSFRPGEEIVINVHRGTKWRYGEKPLMNTENLWKTGYYMPPGPSKFLGEDDVLGPGIDSGRGPMAWMWKQNLDGHRDLGVSALCNYSPVAGVARRGHSLQCFIMPDHTHHCFSGAKVERAYSLHSDLFVPSAFVFRWSLFDPSGKAVASGQDNRQMASGDLQRGKLSFTTPTVKSRTKYTLKLELLADGKFVYGEERDLEIWPGPPPKAALVK